MTCNYVVVGFPNLLQSVSHETMIIIVRLDQQNAMDSIHLKSNVSTVLSCHNLGLEMIDELITSAYSS